MRKEPSLLEQFDRDQNTGPNQAGFNWIVLGLVAGALLAVPWVAFPLRAVVRGLIGAE